MMLKLLPVALCLIFELRSSGLPQGVGDCNTTFIKSSVLLCVVPEAMGLQLV
jgi:type III secretory pathway component EscR